MLPSGLFCSWTAPRPKALCAVFTIHFMSFIYFARPHRSSPTIPNAQSVTFPCGSRTRAFRPSYPATFFAKHIRRLVECGHAFCQMCLEQWFRTITTEYEETHPDYNPYEVTIAPEVVMDAVVHFVPRTFMKTVKDLDIEGPILTCPTCRTTATSRPVETLALKNIVKTVAGAQEEGEGSGDMERKDKGKIRGSHSLDEAGSSLG